MSTNEISSTKILFSIKIDKSTKARVPAIALAGCPIDSCPMNCLNEGQWQYRDRDNIPTKDTNRRLQWKKGKKRF